MTPARFSPILALVLLGVVPTVAPACPFVTNVVVTWRQDVAESKLILYGKLENARQQGEEGQTDLVVEVVLKCDPALGGYKNAKRISIPQYLPIKDVKNPPRILLFADEDPKNGTPDFFRGIVIGPAVIEYLRGLLAIHDKPRVEQLRYYFPYLQHVEKDVADDARAEFANASDDDIKNAAAKLPPEVLREWLSNDKTPRDRLALYARLLGYCGTEEDAKLVRSLLDNNKNDNLPNLDRVYVAYAMLNPTEGWPAAHAAAGEPASDFTRRYNVLNAARFFLENKGVVCEQTLLETFAVFLDQDDIADIAIDYLRQAKCWKLTDRVLAASAKKANNTPLMRRTTIRYALQCPDQAAAKYLAAQRKAAPNLVKEVEELLELELDSTPNKP
jgi:hypothetical protein